MSEHKSPPIPEHPLLPDYVYDDLHCSTCGDWVVIKILHFIFKHHWATLLKDLSVDERYEWYYGENGRI